MIPIAASTLLFSLIDDAVPSGTGNMTTEWATSYMSPGATNADSLRYRGWIQCWVENGTDADLDFAIIPALTTTTTAVIAAATKQYLLLKLPPAQRFVWEFPPTDPLMGPIYVRGTTADPTTGGLRYGGYVK